MHESAENSTSLREIQLRLGREANTAKPLIFDARHGERSRRDASDIDGRAERPNGAFGKSDIEGKVAMGSGE
jgi:hypothetical protein